MHELKFFTSDGAELLLDVGLSPAIVGMYYHVVG